MRHPEHRWSVELRLDGEPSARCTSAHATVFSECKLTDETGTGRWGSTPMADPHALRASRVDGARREAESTWDEDLAEHKDFVSIG